MLLLLSALTLPSILWLYFRFFKIFQERYGIIRHHFQTEGIRMSMHIFVGLLLLVPFPPYLAYLCMPPSEHNDGNDMDAVGVGSWMGKHNTSLFVFSWSTKIILWVIAAGLIALHLTTLFLLPHPKRFEEYKKECSRRNFIKAVASVHGSNLQYMAMCLSALAILLDSDHNHYQQLQQERKLSFSTVFEAFCGTMKVCLLATSWIIYAFTIGISLLEISEKSWEDYDWAKSRLFPSLPFGPKSKSNLVGRTGELSTANMNLTHMFIVGIGAFAWVQTTCQIAQVTLPSSMIILPPPSKAVEAFFTPMLLYSAIVMDAGFFVVSQREISGLTAALDLFLCQVLPIGLTMIGPAWLELEDHNDVDNAPFFWQHTFWTSRYPTY